MSDLTAKKNRSAFSGILHPFRPVGAPECISFPHLVLG